MLKCEEGREVGDRLGEGGPKKKKKDRSAVNYGDTGDRGSSFKVRTRRESEY
jgi:hypothetical protein